MELWGRMTFVLKTAFTESARIKQENQELLGLESGSITGIQLKGDALTSQFERTAREQQKKKSTSDTIFQLLLDQIQATIDAAEGDLRDRYGDDYIGGISAHYGIDTEGLSEEEARARLIEELSKPEYADDEQAQKDLADLRVIDQGQALRKRIAMETEMYGAPTPETEELIKEFLETSGRAAQIEFLENGHDMGVRHTVESGLKSDYTATRALDDQPDAASLDSLIQIP